MLEEGSYKSIRNQSPAGITTEVHWQAERNRERDKATGSTQSTSAALCIQVYR